MFGALAGLFLGALVPNNACNFTVNDRYYPYFHLSPPCGWMNDPNGFSFFNGKYHMFYQYNDLSSQEAGIARWGHATSPDLVNWKHLQIAMYPDQAYDKDGVFSGSAIIHNETMYLLYTGNVNHADQNPNKTQVEALAYSTDGVNFTKYPENPVILGEEYQPNLRDPKVWQYNDTFYMVLGNSFNNNTLGRILLYTSKDLITWEEVSVISEAKDTDTDGYMYECPDFFEISGLWVLLYSPQGIKPQGDKYNNLYQTGYIVGNFDYTTNIFTAITDFKALDHGTDFYATQTMLDDKGRRIMVAWFDMWEQVYPERDDGWTGQQTFPRELTLTEDNIIIQTPIEEIETVRDRFRLLHWGAASVKTSVKLPNNAGEIEIKAAVNANFTVILEAVNVTVTINYDHENSKISVDRGGDDGFRRTDWSPKDELKLRILVDRSSVEVFCGEGEVTFSTRFFPGGKVSVKLGENSTAEEMTVYAMKRTVPAP